MKLTIFDGICITLIVLSLVLAAVLYPALPDRIPIHWNIKGEADSYGSKFVGLFLFPIIILAVYLLFLFIPKIDPFRKNIVSFGRQLEIFKLVIVVFFLVIYGIIILQYWGLKFNIVYVLMPVMAAFFYYIGHIMKHVKRNYFIGIRTPWTLADDTVWEKTHNIGSITFKINAVILVFGLINPVLMFWIFIGSLAVNVVFLYAYSYYIWKKLKKQAK